MQISPRALNKSLGGSRKYRFEHKMWGSIVVLYNYPYVSLYIKSRTATLVLGSGCHSGNLLNSWAGWEIDRIVTRAKPTRCFIRTGISPDSCGYHRKWIEATLRVA